MDQALMSEVWFMIMPMTPPRNSLPPKTRAAEKPMRICRNTKDALENVWIRMYQELVSSAPPTALLMPSVRPMSRPEATMAGMMGTKTSPSALMARWNGLALAAAAALASSFELAEMPARAMNSSKTLLTVPVP